MGIWSMGPHVVRGFQIFYAIVIQTVSGPKATTRGPYNLFWTCGVCRVSILRTLGMCRYRPSMYIFGPEKVWGRRFLCTLGCVPPHSVADSFPGGVPGVQASRACTHTYTYTYTYTYTCTYTYTHTYTYTYT